MTVQHRIKICVCVRVCYKKVIFFKAFSFLFSAFFVTFWLFGTGVLNPIFNRFFFPTDGLIRYDECSGIVGARRGGA